VLIVVALSPAPPRTPYPQEIKARHPGVPLLGFARDAPYGLAYLQRAGYDVMTVDAAIGGGVARGELEAEARAGGGSPGQLQGNFDPALLHKVGWGRPLREQWVDGPAACSLRPMSPCTRVVRGGARAVMITTRVHLECLPRVVTQRLSKVLRCSRIIPRAPDGGTRGFQLFKTPCEFVRTPLPPGHRWRRGGD